MAKTTETTRDNILTACWQLLENGQAAKVRMSDIAKKAGVSRQAVYLHFPNRADLLIATTRFIDEKSGIEVRLEESRAAQRGLERLDAYVTAWGNYIPVIYGVARALLAMSPLDNEARDAWSDRMAAMRQGCEAAVIALGRDDDLVPDYTVQQATDLLWTLLSVHNWEHLVHDCDWPQADYVAEMKRLARATITLNR